MRIYIIINICTIVSQTDDKMFWFGVFLKRVIEFKLKCSLR
jgi:hypothetical protein